MTHVVGAINWDLLIQLSVTGFIGFEAMVYAMAAIGLNVHFGYTGLLNFGHVGFLAMGGYGVGISIVMWHLNPYLAIVIGILFAVVLALLLGVPTLRLRADYLAIVTIAASEVIRIFARSTSLRGITRGAEGLNEFAGDYYALSPFKADRCQWGIINFPSCNQMFVTLVGWIAIALLVFLVWQLMRSPWGRVLKAIREDEDAARALGKNTFWYKMQSLVLGGAIGGLAGIFQVIGKSSVQPDTFVPPITFIIWTVLILGGAGRVFSPVVGSMIFWGVINFIETFLRQLVPSTALPIGQVRFMLVGAFLMLLMTFRPQGIFGSREEMALSAR